MQPLTGFDNFVLKVINKEIELAVQSVAQKYGITIKYVGASYSSLEATTKLKLSCTSITGETKGESDFKKYAEIYGLKPEMLGKVFNMRSGRGFKTYKIMGLIPNKRVNNIMVQDIITKKEYVCKALDISTPIDFKTLTSDKRFTIGKEDVAFDKLGI